MTKIEQVRRLATLSLDVLKSQGPGAFVDLGVAHVKRTVRLPQRGHLVGDILFVNGTTLPHPERYRVDHQIEQLMSRGIAADKVYFEQLTLSYLPRYRGFVFFRCPVTPQVREFIAAAKAANRAVFFDIDDLVIDQKYVETIPYVAAMPTAERSSYDDGVRRMRETMLMCDHVMTTTDVLGDELRQYVPDVLVNRNVVSEQMVALSNRAVDSQNGGHSGVTIGYFSGSVTHNADLDMVLPDLIATLDSHPQVTVKLVGLLDCPQALAKFGSRVTTEPFMDWRKLPRSLASCDIVIAPLVDTIFNRAKSENKWMEAALVGVPVVASDLGAFHDVVENGDTGLLVGEGEWADALARLISDADLRHAIGQRAREVVLERHGSVSTAGPLADWVTDRLARHVGFVVPSCDVSGGVNVILKHADILRAHGFCVTIVNAASAELNRHSRHLDPRGYDEIATYDSKVKTRFDMLVGTYWTTIGPVLRYPYAQHKAYFVQNLETDFMSYGDSGRLAASATYSRGGIEFFTMSTWCQRWLKERYGQDATLIGNGLDLATYPVRTREVGAGKVRILIEGDSGDAVKNVDESFRIVARLDPAKFYVGYLSYRHGPKSWYRVDKVHNRVPADKVGGIYASYDILLKSSRLESFSYPPIEMMATGGYVVVRPNDGNAEYLRPGENCLVYDPKDLGTAVEAIKRIVADASLRQALRAGGLATAAEHSWESRQGQILDLYENGVRDGAGLLAP